MRPPRITKIGRANRFHGTGARQQVMDGKAPRGDDAGMFLKVTRSISGMFERPAASQILAAPPSRLPGAGCCACAHH